MARTLIAISKAKVQAGLPRRSQGRSGLQANVPRCSLGTSRLTPTAHLRERGAGLWGAASHERMHGSVSACQARRTHTSRLLVHRSGAAAPACHADLRWGSPRGPCGTVGARELTDSQACQGEACGAPGRVAALAVPSRCCAGCLIGTRRPLACLPAYAAGARDGVRFYAICICARAAAAAPVHPPPGKLPGASCSHPLCPCVAFANRKALPSPHAPVPAPRLETTCG